MNYKFIKLRAMFICVKLLINFAITIKGPTVNNIISTQGQDIVYIQCNHPNSTNLDTQLDGLRITKYCFRNEMGI